MILIYIGNFKLEGGMRYKINHIILAEIRANITDMVGIANIDSIANIDTKKHEPILIFQTMILIDHCV